MQRMRGCFVARRPSRLANFKAAAASWLQSFYFRGPRPSRQPGCRVMLAPVRPRTAD